MAQIPIPFLFDAPGHHHDHGGASLGPCTWHPNRWPLPTFGCASPAGKQMGWLFPGDLVSGGEILALDSQVMSIDVNWSVKWCNRKIQIDRRKPPTNMGFQEIDIGDVNINNSYHPWQAHILAFSRGTSFSSTSKSVMKPVHLGPLRLLIWSPWWSHNDFLISSSLCIYIQIQHI